MQPDIMVSEICMRAMVLYRHNSVEKDPLVLSEIETPTIGEDDVLIKVSKCGVCRTDLHIVEGELKPPRLPIVPGHQVVGTVVDAGKNVSGVAVGERVGVPWLYYACGRCKYCTRGLENLCLNALFTGYNVNGGYAEYIVAKADFVHKIPENIDDLHAAPLLCAGAIGYRALRLSGVGENDLLGLFGYGSSAHLVLQIAVKMGIKVYVYTSSPWKVEHAIKHGAEWAGLPSEAPPVELDAAIVFAPASTVFIEALKRLRGGGRVVLAEIYMTPIEHLDYSLLWREREVKTVANVTRKDVREVLELASTLGVKPDVTVFELSRANDALKVLKRGHLGQIVLDIT
ncbi:MAG: zinc-dependent alcohol dehydrogenase family protein [Desulfurococcaceae archaeon]